MTPSVFTEPVLTAALLALLASAMPLLLAAVGETVGEQSGVLNVGLEGLLLIGGFTGFSIALASGGVWFGLFGGALAGAALAAVLAVLCVWLGANQIVVGIGLTLAGTGLSSLLYEHFFAGSKPRLGAIDAWVIPGLSQIPVLGPGLFAQPGAFTLSLLLPVLVWWWLRRSDAGLRLRVAGQRPESLEAYGGSVHRVRTAAVLFGGAMAGFAGAYLATISAGTFTPGMTHGMGFLAIVVAMLGRGRMLLVLLLSLAYGLFVAAGTTMQLAGVSIPSDAISMLPFIAVLIVLIFFATGSAVPPALAQPYARLTE